MDKVPKGYEYGSIARYNRNDKRRDHGVTVRRGRKECKRKGKKGVVGIDRRCEQCENITASLLVLVMVLVLVLVVLLMARTQRLRLRRSTITIKSKIKQK